MKAALEGTRHLNLSPFTHHCHRSGAGLMDNMYHIPSTPPSSLPSLPPLSPPSLSPCDPPPMTTAARHLYQHTC